ncbi:MAG: NifU-like protein [Tardiphaga sp.]|nr:NifU-like protein [Tardiphaga sp.]
MPPERLSPYENNTSRPELNSQIPAFWRRPGILMTCLSPYIGFSAPAAKAAPVGELRFEPMLNDIYNKRIIELAGNIPRLGRLPHPDASATAHSKLCGSTVKIDLTMDGPVVTDFAHDVKACALGQASSSIMASHVVGSTAGELRALRETVRKMLKENGAPPDGKWADIALLEPVRDYKARHASTLLTFDAVVDAIGQVEAKTGNTAPAA